MSVRSTIDQRLRFHMECARASDKLYSNLLRFGVVQEQRVNTLSRAPSRRELPGEATEPSLNQKWSQTEPEDVWYWHGKYSRSTYSHVSCPSLPRNVEKARGGAGLRKSVRCVHVEGT